MIQDVFVLIYVRRHLDVFKVSLILHIKMYLKNIYIISNPENFQFIQTFKMATKYKLLDIG